MRDPRGKQAEVRESNVLVLEFVVDQHLTRYCWTWTREEVLDVTVGVKMKWMSLELRMLRNDRIRVMGNKFFPFWSHQEWWHCFGCIGRMWWTLKFYCRRQSYQAVKRCIRIIERNDGIIQSRESGSLGSNLDHKYALLGSNCILKIWFNCYNLNLVFIHVHMHTHTHMHIESPCTHTMNF